MIKKYMELPRNIWIYLLVSIFFSISGTIIPFLILFLNTTFKLSEFNSDILFSLIILSFIPTSILGGKIAQEKNKKNSIIILRFFYALNLLLVSQVNIVYLKIFFLILAFIFMGFSRPVLNSFICDIVKEEHIKLAYSLIYMGESIGGILSPLIMGYFFHNMEMVFGIYGVLTLFACIIIIFFVKINTKVIMNQNNAMQMNKKNVSLVSIIPIAIIFIVFEFCYGQQSYTLPIQINEIFKNGSILYGYITSINYVLILIATPILTLLSNKVKTIYSLLFSGIFCGIGFGILYYAHSNIVFFIAVIIWTIGEILYCINAFVYLCEILGENNSGIASTVILISRSIGICLCSFVSSYLIALYDISLVWIITPLLSIMAAFMLYYKKKKFF